MHCGELEVQAVSDHLQLRAVLTVRPVLHAQQRLHEVSHVEEILLKRYGNGLMRIGHHDKVLKLLWELSTLLLKIGKCELPLLYCYLLMVYGIHSWEHPDQV